MGILQLVWPHKHQYLQCSPKTLRPGRTRGGPEQMDGRSECGPSPRCRDQAHRCHWDLTGAKKLALLPRASVLGLVRPRRQAQRDHKSQCVLPAQQPSHRPLESPSAREGLRAAAYGPVSHGAKCRSCSGPSIRDVVRRREKCAPGCASHLTSAAE